MDYKKELMEIVHNHNYGIVKPKEIKQVMDFIKSYWCLDFGLSTSQIVYRAKTKCIEKRKIIEENPSEDFTTFERLIAYNLFDILTDIFG